MCTALSMVLVDAEQIISGSDDGTRYYPLVGPSLADGLVWCKVAPESWGIGGSKVVSSKGVRRV